MPGLDPKNIQHPEARNLLAACLCHPDFEVIELRKLEINTYSRADVIVVDCCDGTIPSRNSVGIRNRERLALFYCSGFPHEVRALRRDFPVTLHQNHILSGEPASLCLYFEPWSAVERDWTPQRHLERILWWLRETALGTLHRSDQPLEYLYFTPPYDIVLPPNFLEKTATDGQLLSFFPIQCPGTKPRIIWGDFIQDSLVKKYNLPFGDFLVISPQPLNHGPVQRHPQTLGEFHDQFKERGSEIIGDIKAALRNKVTSAGIEKQTDVSTLLLVITSVRRAPDQPPERSETQAFFIHADIATIGIASGALIDGRNGKFYVDYSIGETESAEKNKWQDFVIEPIGVKIAVTPEFSRNASDVLSEKAQFRGVLAGVGALGSVLADFWAREGWGEWTYVDDDYVFPHNVVRHIARNEHIGRSKVETVRDLTNGIYYPGQISNIAIHAKISDRSNERLAEMLTSADLIVDATTTLEVPRDLSVQESAPRTASVFLTPSGHGSVLLIEDHEKSVPLHALESQYYRAVLNAMWGANHLKGHAGELWVGAGCRDISAVISYELVQLHGSMLARQLRKLAAKDESQMRVWELDDASGTLTSYNLPVSKVIIEQHGKWCVVWDNDLRDKFFAMRAHSLPNETGGIILGYFDQKLKMLHLVDALPAPSDSESSVNGFTRGTKGLREDHEECLRRTAHVVDYVGEWHSHPRGVTACASELDMDLIAHLSTMMAQAGLPAIMIIVGENSIKIQIGEADIL